jgi:allantoicase
MRNLQQLNSLPPEDAEAELLKCCGSQSWASRVVAHRPFSVAGDLLKSAEAIWWSLDKNDWLEAFSSHPKIGEQKPVRKIGHTAEKWSEQEQSAIIDAPDQTRLELAALNKEYEEKFGFIFIVCATGKSSEELLAILKERLSHTRDEELQLAAEEQAKITNLRINKLLNS